MIRSTKYTETGGHVCVSRRSMNIVIMCAVFVRLTRWYQYLSAVFVCARGMVGTCFFTHG